MQQTCWNYSKEEWKNFLHWKNRKKGWFFLIFRKMMPVKAQHIPEITITDNTVWVNKAQQPFRDDERKFSEITIREVGAVNILEIRYRQHEKQHHINIPVPKGKLREAFEVQERLQTTGSG